MLPTLAIAGWLLLECGSALAGGVVVTIIDGRKAKADITLPNPGGGSYTAEFELEFEVENLQNLTVECIGITADVLTPAEIADIQNNRLPHTGGQQIVPTAFPVRVTVEPPVGCGLAFQNHYDVTLETDDLAFNPGGPYRLMKAPIGQMFHYVTGSVTQGSVRSRGRAGGFSEFIMIADQSPVYATDCENEYDDLEGRLAAATMSPTARRALETDLAVSRAAYEAGNFTDAIQRLATFDAHCVEYGGAGLPNRWRSARDLDDTEGELIGHTDNLRFMMGRLSGLP
ncbi:MAG TPA: DUF6689 family protein [Rhodanobacteraceae bacterium]|nr:DUF6689 family protein [Rhodanobacteraceae bacterium]